MSTTSTTTTTTTTTTLPPAIPTFALRGFNSANSAINGQLVKYLATAASGYILSFRASTMTSSYVNAKFHLEASTNRLRIDNLYIVGNGGLGVYSVPASKLHEYTPVSCAAPARIGRALECTFEGTVNTQFRTDSLPQMPDLQLLLDDPAADMDASGLASVQLIVESAA